MSPFKKKLVLVPGQPRLSQTHPLLKRACCLLGRRVLSILPQTDILFPDDLDLDFIRSAAVWGSLADILIFFKVFYLLR